MTTIEFDPHHAKIAQENFDMAGVADRITLLVGSGVEVGAKLLEDHEAGNFPTLDLTFIDADKQSNWIYFEYAVQMSRPGAVIIVDNVVRSGAVVDPEMYDVPKVQGSREVIEKAGKDPRVATSLLQTVGDKNYDGMLICVKL